LLRVRKARRCFHAPALAISPTSAFTLYTSPPLPRLCAGFITPCLGAKQPKAAARAKVSSDP
jgi:hypothetical protein